MGWPRPAGIRHTSANKRRIAFPSSGSMKATAFSRIALPYGCQSAPLLKSLSAARMATSDKLLDFSRCDTLSRTVPQFDSCDPEG